MDLNEIGVFVRVVEHASFTAAAQSLGLPKSSVSRSVSRLEQSLGIRLLQRTTRRLQLTDAGRAYFEKARAALAELEQASADVVKLGSEPRGTVRLTIAPGEKGMLEPMVSQLGVTSDEIPLKLSVRSGGKKEQQVVIVKNVLAESLRKEFEKAQK